MEIVLTGLSHHTAPIEAREAAALRGDQLPAALARLAAVAADGAIISTCNRTEIYAYGGPDAVALAATLRAQVVGPDTVRPAWYTLQGAAAVAHLFAVAAGLDSLIPGEVQILGQIKHAWAAAHAAGVAGPVCSALFQRALAAGKRVRNETPISTLPASVSYAAVALVRRILGSLSGRQVLVIGAGAMGEGVARCLMANGAGTLLVANRHPERAAALAAAQGGRPVAWAAIPAALRQVDIVISATDAPGFVLDAATVHAARPSGTAAPLHLIDLAVPRDIDPACADLPGVFLHNIDHLRAVIDSALTARRQVLPQATAIVADEAQAFLAWLDERRAAPTIAALHQQAETIRRQETDWALARLSTLSAHDRQIVEALASRLVGKLLHGPTVRLRQLAAADDGAHYAAAIDTVFDLHRNAPDHI